MNTYQKICIATGACVIAVMLLFFPVKETKEIQREGGGIRFRNTYTTETYIDYGATAINCLGIAAITGALTLLLGLVRKN